MTTMRDIDQDGSKIKTDWNDKQYLDHWRAEWARYANHAVDLWLTHQHALTTWVKAQGIDRNRPTSWAEGVRHAGRGVVVDRFRRVMVDLITMLKARRVARRTFPSPPITTPPRARGDGRGR
jgi:hypothetical protein